MCVWGGVLQTWLFLHSCTFFQIVIFCVFFPPSSNRYSSKFLQALISANTPIITSCSWG